MTRRQTALIEFYVAISEKARKEGLLALEQDIPEYKTNLAKIGMQLVVDGVESEILEQILDNCIAADGKGAGLRWLHAESSAERKMERAAILGIHSGISPRMLRLVMLSFLGEQAVVSAMDHDYVYLYQDRFNDIELLDDRAVQKVLREVSAELMADALSHGPETVTARVMQNMSQNAQTMLADEINTRRCRKEDSVSAQSAIGEIMDRLHNQGEISFDSGAKSE